MFAFTEVINGLRIVTSKAGKLVIDLMEIQTQSDVVFKKVKKVWKSDLEMYGNEFKFDEDDIIEANKAVIFDGIAKVKCGLKYHEAKLMCVSKHMTVYEEIIGFQNTIICSLIKILDNFTKIVSDKEITSEELSVTESYSDAYNIIKKLVEKYDKVDFKTFDKIVEYKNELKISTENFTGLINNINVSSRHTELKNKIEGNKEYGSTQYNGHIKNINNFMRKVVENQDQKLIFEAFSKIDEIRFQKFIKDLLQFIYSNPELTATKNSLVTDLASVLTESSRYKFIQKQPIKPESALELFKTTALLSEYDKFDEFIGESRIKPKTVSILISRIVETYSNPKEMKLQSDKSSYEEGIMKLIENTEELKILVNNKKKKSKEKKSMTMTSKDEPNKSTKAELVDDHEPDEEFL